MIPACSRVLALVPAGPAEPLPERLVVAAPEAVIDNALGEYASPGAVFSSEVRDAYIKALRDPAGSLAICEE